MKKNTLIIRNENKKETIVKLVNAFSMLATYTEMQIKEPTRFTYICNKAKDENNMDVMLHIVTDELTKVSYTFVI